MSILKALERVSYSYYLLRQRKTGNPREFAQKLGLSKSQMYENIDELKALGLPIEYCKKTKSYFLAKEVQFDLENLFRTINKDELDKVKGGSLNYFQLFFQSPVASDFTPVNLQRKYDNASLLQFAGHAENLSE